MQVDRHVDPDRRIVILTVSGELSDQGLLEIGDLLEQSPDVRPDFSLLVDLRHASGAHISPSGVRALAARRLVLSPESRRAVVVPSALGYGMARMYQILRSRRGAMRVFRDFDKALHWIETGLA